MAAVNILDALESQVAPTLRRCPRALIEQKAREILRDFCKFTRAWQYLPAAQNIVATQATYVLLTPGNYAEAIAAEWVQVSNPAGSGGDASIPKTTDWLDMAFPSWRINAADDFRYFVQESSASITFSGKPLTPIVGGLSYRVSLRPVIAATQVDDSITNEFAEELACGTKWKLQSMAGEAWHNEKAAMESFKYYVAGRGRARITMNKRYGPGDAPMLSFTSKYRFA